MKRSLLEAVLALAFLVMCWLIAWGLVELVFWGFL